MTDAEYEFMRNAIGQRDLPQGLGRPWPIDRARSASGAHVSPYWYRSVAGVIVPPICHRPRFASATGEGLVILPGSNCLCGTSCCGQAIS